MTLLEWEQYFPQNPWREPVQMSLFTGEGGWACRVCIANDGLLGKDVPKLPADPEAVRTHIRKEHLL